MAQRKRGVSGRSGTRKSARTAQRPTRFIVSDEKTPSVTVKAGTKLSVQSVVLVDPSLRPMRKPIGARLCGGSGTCLALVEL